MHKPLNLSESIVMRVPEQRRYHNASNIKWALNNLQLSPLERKECIAAYRAELDRIGRLDK